MNVKPPSCAVMAGALRAKAGMTQKAIADATGFSQGFISYLCAGKRSSMDFEEGMILFNLYADKVLKRKLALVPAGRVATKN